MSLMASPPPVDRRGRSHVHAAAVSRVGASKAQAALAKILAIISAAPGSSSPRSHSNSGGVDPEEETGLRFDLRLRLGPPLEISGGSAEGTGPAAGRAVAVASAPVESDDGALPSVKEAPTSAAGCSDALAMAKSSEGECDPEEGSREQSSEGDDRNKEVETKGNSEVEESGTATATTIKSSCSNSSSTRRGRDRGSEGCLDLLLEAVRHVSGGAFDDVDVLGAEKLEPPPPAVAEEEEEEEEEEGPLAPAGKTRAKKRREAGECWIPFDLYEEGTAPIVRSKRGRSQALPSRYRDSVLDPWRKPPALARHGRPSRP